MPLHTRLRQQRSKPMYFPHTEAERKAMLDTIGVGKMEDLFLDVPKKQRFPRLNLPEALTEMEVSAEMQFMASANESTRDLACFLGAGAYNHFIPAAVSAITSRGEFLSAY